jgi:hypothetical protein
MDIRQLFSGLIGVAFGVAATVFLYWFNRYTIARHELINCLSLLLHDVHWNCDSSDVFETWDASLKKVWLLYNAFISVSPPILRRGRVRKAWRDYKGEDHDRMKKLAKEGRIVDDKAAPKDKEEFLRKINSFLRALGKGVRQKAPPDCQ